MKPALSMTVRVRIFDRRAHRRQQWKDIRITPCAADRGHILCLRAYLILQRQAGRQPRNHGIKHN